MRYLNIFLIICIVTSYSFMCCGCNSTSKKSKIQIKHESKLSKYRPASGSVINLSDGRKVNFDGVVGPQDISNPSFNVVNVGMP